MWGSIGVLFFFVAVLGAGGCWFPWIFLFCVWTKPCARGQHQEAACCQGTQPPAAALLAALSLLCHLPVPSPAVFSLWQPKGGRFSHRFTGQFLHAPTATTVPMDPFPGTGAAAEISHCSFQSGHLLGRAAVNLPPLCSLLWFAFLLWLIFS